MRPNVQPFVRFGEKVALLLKKYAKRKSKDVMWRIIGAIVFSILYCLNPKFISFSIRSRWL